MIKQLYQGFSGFKKDILKTFGANILLACISVITGTLLARLLGPAGRGELAASTVWGGFLLGVGSLGLPQAIVYFSGRNCRDPGGVAGNALFLGALQAVLIPAVGFLLMPMLLKAQGPQVVVNARWYLLVVCAGFWGGYPMFVLQGMAYFTAFNGLRLFHSLLYLTFLSGLIYWGISRPAAVIQILIVWAFLTGIANLTCLHRLGRPRWRLDRFLIRPMFSYGVKTWASAIPILLNGRLDQMLMTFFLPAEQLGLYVVAVAWSACLNPLSVAFATPTFSRLAQTEEGAGRVAILARTFRISVLAQGLLALLAMLITPIAIKILFGNKFTPAIPAALLLLLGSLALGMNSVLGDGLRGLGLPAGQAYGEITGLIFTVIFLFLLIPMFGILGAALASVISYLSTLIVLIIYTYWHTKVSFKMMVPSFSELFEVLSLAHCRTK